MDTDVIVAGAGLAGLRAARDLTDEGRRVVVLEARERIGGRGYTVELGGRHAELGGSWFTPEHDEVRAEIGRAGMDVRDYPALRGARWLTDGRLRQGLPVPWPELEALEDTLARVRDDAARVAAGDRELAAMSAAAYVDALGPSDALRDFLLGWWQLMGGARPERGAVADALSSIHDHGGLSGLVTCLAHSPAGGWSSLAGAMASQSDAELLLGTRLVAVDQDDAGVTCTTADGAAIRAAALILAVPINCLPPISFTPPLPAATAEGAGANAGAAVKVLMLARGVEPLTIAAGIGPGLNWLYADDLVGDEVLVTGFGWQDGDFDQHDRDDVNRALTAFHPEAELIDWASHDWIADPASMGTWLTAPAGRLDLVDPARFRPAGRIVFAGSDVAEEQAGWFEGALRSGAAAARTVQELITSVARS